MKFYKTTNAIAHLTDGDIDFFDIVTKYLKKKKISIFYEIIIC